jgi:RNA polymerase sigma factor (sigma-70 family)
VTRPWTTTTGDFSAFIAWLDGGVDSGGRSYIDIHSRLAAHFARKGCGTPEELADETLSRVSRRLQEEGGRTDVSPPHYCYIVARFVLLEYLRSADHRRAPLLREVHDETSSADGERGERLLARLDDCLGRLSPEDRQLIVAYYSGDGPSQTGTRRELAARLGLSANALTIRASRLRERLRACLAAQQKDA